MPNRIDADRGSLIVECKSPESGEKEYVNWSQRRGIMEKAVNQLDNKWDSRATKSRRESLTRIMKNLDNEHKMLLSTLRMATCKTMTLIHDDDIVRKACDAVIILVVTSASLIQAIASALVLNEMFMASVARLVGDLARKKVSKAGPYCLSFVPPSSSPSRRDSSTFKKNF